MSHFVATYGYWAVLLFVMAESLGVPVPGETALIVAAGYAGHSHHMSPWLIFTVASAGAIIGDNVGFWIGHRIGYRLVREHGARVRLDERKLKTTRYVFDRYGPKVVFFGRFVSILRTYAALLAGTSRMQWHRFVPANAGGAILWAGVTTLAAYFAGTALTRLSGPVDVALGAGAVLGAGFMVLAARHQSERLAVRAEAAYPGPLE